MGAKFGGDDDVIADINITPFVDIILVVLIIFMVTATTIAKQSIQVELPEASTGEATDVTSLGLTLTADGQLLLDGQPVSTAELTDALDRAKKNDTVTLISADKSVAHGRVVWLIDMVRSRGIHKFAINIDDATKVAPAGGGAP
jgi:biopolymer transport protein ExbD